ncbi:MAG: hypothetical protein PF447_10625 [Spirochaetaceae bacterium]|jgi:hypothetical protein|nr:hypothetical protein [Spirochaetaceae bacterium]
MKSTIYILLLVVMGSLSFSHEPNGNSLWEYNIESSLEQQNTYERLALWVEEIFPYSQKQYSWSQGNPVITIDQALSVIPQNENRPSMRYSYNLIIEVVDQQVLLTYSQVTPFSTEATALFIPGRRKLKGPWEDIRQDLLTQSRYMKELLEVRG